MVQVIRRTPQAPVRNKGQQFAEAFSNLAQTGTQHLYAQAEKAKKSNALKQYLGKGYEDLDFSNLDDDTIKEIVKQEAKSKARQNYFGGNDPLAQPQPGTFGEQFQNAPVDVQIGATPASENAGETEGQKIKRLENELEKMQIYKKELMEYFLEHYDNYRPEKVQDLEDVTRRIADKEELWLMLNAENEKDLIE